MAPVNVKCPIEDSDYTATHAEAAVVATLLSVHATVHVAVKPGAGRECENGETQAPGRSTCQDRWSEYKTGTKLVRPDVVALLLKSCDDELRKHLACTAGKALINSDEKDVIAAMKALAVRSWNTGMVALE